MTPSRLPALFLLSALLLRAQDRPGLFFREDWKETPAATPITQAHVASPDLILSLHGPGKAGLKKSHHDKPADDPYYVWSGTAEANWAVSLRHASKDVDLRGLAKIRWRTKQAGFRYLRPILRLADGTWLIGDAADGPSSDWREREFPISDIRWRLLDIATIVEGKWADHPDLSRVTEIGFTDLMRGGQSGACSRLDWIEVHGLPVPRKP
ncbi:MAG: hypothetical protein IT166_05305 [Bryobacterales bacterium]|nr:hypothetical protein [Bryobacterales bacterium]